MATEDAGRQAAIPAIPATAAAYEAAARIRSLLAAAQTLAQMLEAQIMESMWTIRRELPVDPDFEAFVSAQTPIAVDRAWLMVRTWDVARRQRELRELARRAPSEALALITSSVEAGVEIADATDRQVTAILSRSPRRRNQAIRDLIESAASDAGPEARERIRTLETERDQALDELVTERALSEHPSARAAALVETLQTVERQAAEIAMDAEIAIDEHTPEAVRSRVVALADSMVGSLDRITGAVYADLGAQGEP